MIVIEDVFESIFSYIPPMKYSEADTAEFAVTFGAGDRKELNLFLSTKSAENTDPYPLIWLEYPYLEHHYDNKVEAKNVSLILAVNTNSSMRNKQRLNETFKNVLNPLFDNIRHCFKSANIVNVSGEYKLVKFPQYSDESSSSGSHATTDIWDAIKITFNIQILDRVECLRDIKF